MATDKASFFRAFIAFDCQDMNDGFDVESIQYYRPWEIERIIRRLYYFGATAHGMDIAVYMGPGRGARGCQWGIVAGDGPRRNTVEAWLELVRKDRLQECILSLTYTIPDEVLALFSTAQQSEAHPDAQDPTVH